MYPPSIVDDVGFTSRERWRVASQDRLAAQVRRARPAGLPRRARLGRWLVRAGYSLGAPRPAA